MTWVFDIQINFLFNIGVDDKVNFLKTNKVNFKMGLVDGNIRVQVEILDKKTIFKIQAVLDIKILITINKVN